MTAPPQKGPVSLRAAFPADLQILKSVYFRAKASHGYSADEMADFAAEVDETLTVETITHDAFAIAEMGGRAVGFVGVQDTGKPNALHMEFLFIDPEAQGQGVGRRLFDWAVEEVRRRGFAALEFQSDVNAAGFYERIGAVKISERPSTVIPGRMIPTYRFEVQM